MRDIWYHKIQNRPYFNKLKLTFLVNLMKLDKVGLTLMCVQSSISFPIPKKENKAERLHL